MFVLLCDKARLASADWQEQYDAEKAVLGYCPGTGVAACGEGRKDVYFGLLGTFVGAGIFVTFYPAMSKLIGALGDAGKVTLPQVTNRSP